jgi:hypothetical protein
VSRTPRSDRLIERAVGTKVSVSARYTYRKNNKLTATDDLALPNAAFSIPTTATDPITAARSPLVAQLAPPSNQQVLTQFDNNYTR